MKRFLKRGAALMIALFLVASLLPGSAFTASAATYVYNWGQRGELATELSDSAVAFYEKYSVTYESLSALSGASSTSSVPGSALYSRLKTLMTSAHSDINSYNDIKTLAKYTDCQNGGGAISSFYSGTSVGPTWDGTWNREHTWPNSKGLGGSDEDDIMMIRPTSYEENGSRSNTAYGESSSYYHPNSESGGAYDLRGDCARICLYVYVRWGNTSYMWGTSGVMESKEVLLKWMEEDPVDTWELGRNDSVQSITGTRNVFVDFPELAFDLFEEEVPDGYQSPSGITSSYTITAYPNNTSYGTVSMSGKTITAYPYEGYQVSGYQVISGTATVTQSGNEFKVSASSDCSVQILFEPRVQATVTFVDQGTTLSSQTAYAGDVITLPQYSETAPDGYVFCGWVKQQLAETEAKPDIHMAGGDYTVGTTTTFYALFAKIEEGSTAEPIYTLVTDASQLSEGATVVITASGTTALAMKSTGGTNNRYAGTITKNTDNTISFAEDALIDVLTLGNGTLADTYTFFSEANGQYLAAGTSSGNNILKLQSSVDAAASFAVTVNSDGTVTAVSQTSSDRNSLRYNSGANVFACYASGQKAISLYVCTGGGVLFYTTDPVSCEHTNTSAVAAVEANCTQSGFTAGVQCDDCGRLISGHEVVDALGHSWGSWTQSSAPACTQAGQQSRTCSVCGETETQSVAAAGHSYNTVVTAPTATEQGYTTYTCSVCGDSYISDYTEALGETYTVSFVVPGNVTSIADMSCGKAGITLPEAGIPKGDYTYSFTGWLATTLDNSEEAPEYYAAGDTFCAAANTTLYALYTYTVGGTGNVEYTLTDIADITDTDSVVITMTYNNGTVYALDNDNGTASAPTAVIISALDGKLTEEPADNLKWNIGGSSGEYIFYPEGSTASWLYCTSTNNGVRVGTNSNKTFYIDSATGYLRHTETGRYVGVYRGNPDWRCYTSQTTNIGDQTLGFYVKGEAGTTYYTTVITNSCAHESYESGVCTNCGMPEPVQITGMDMLLSDDLKVNFHLNARTDVTVTVGGNEIAFSAEELKAADDGTYVATVSVAAAQMTDEITVRAVGCDDAKVYTIRQYADKLLSDEAYAQYHGLVKEMLNYGGYAQEYFGYHTAELANEGISDAGAEAVPETTNDFSVSGVAESIGLYAVSLSYRDKVALRFYFRTTGDIENYTFSASGMTYTPVQKDTCYVVEVPGITPEKLDKQVELTVADANGDTLIISYSPMNYIVRMNGKGGDSLKALLKALYNYHLAAKQLRAEA